MKPFNSRFAVVLALALLAGPLAPTLARAASAQPVLLVISNQDFWYQDHADTRAGLEAAGLEVVVAAAANRLVGECVRAGKHVAGIAYGVWVLAYARVDGRSPVHGRTVTTWPNTVPGFDRYGRAAAAHRQPPHCHVGFRRSQTAGIPQC